MYVFKSKHYIHQSTSVDFHVFLGGVRCLPAGFSYLPDENLLLGLTRKSFENFAFSPVSQAVSTGVHWGRVYNCFYSRGKLIENGLKMSTGSQTSTKRMNSHFTQPGSNLKNQWTSLVI